MPTATCSIIIPTFNHGKYIERSVQCALDQTYPDVEVIVVDDGSEDDTAAKLARFGDKIVYHRKENGGLGAARNTGIELSRGEYLQFLDADDTIAPEKLERQIRTLETDSGLAVVYSDCSCNDPEERVLENTSYKLGDGEPALAMLVMRNLFSVHAALVRKSWVVRAGLFDKSRVAQEDWQLWTKIAAMGGRFQYSAGDYAHYDQTGSEMTTNPQLMYRRMRHMLEVFQTDPVFLKLDQGLVKKFVANQNIGLATRSYNNGWWRTARRHFVLAARAHSGSMDVKHWSCIPKAMIHQLIDRLRKQRREIDGY